MEKLVLNLIRAYQTIFSWRVCRFQPSCSEYTYQAVEKYGTIKGLSLGLLRIVKCHPFSKGGYDPVK